MTLGTRSGVGALLVGAAVVLAALALASLFGGPTLAWGACKHRYAKPYKQHDNVAARAVVCLVNRHRDDHGRGRVDRNRDLGQAARRHTRYMQDHHCWSDTCSGEAGLMERVSLTGYLSGASGYGCGETIAWNKGRKATPKRIVRSWMHDPAHRSILLDGRYQHIGAGVVWGSPSKASANAGIYTVDLCYRSG